MISTRKVCDLPVKPPNIQSDMNRAHRDRTYMHINDCEFQYRDPHVIYAPNPIVGLTVPIGVNTSRGTTVFTYIWHTLMYMVFLSSYPLLPLRPPPPLTPFFLHQFLLYLQRSHPIFVTCSPDPNRSSSSISKRRPSCTVGPAHAPPLVDKQPVLNII